MIIKILQRDLRKVFVTPSIRTCTFYSSSKKTSLLSVICTGYHIHVDNMEIDMENGRKYVFKTNKPKKKNNQNLITGEYPCDRKAPSEVCHFLFSKRN